MQRNSVFLGILLALASAPRTIALPSVQSTPTVAARNQTEADTIAQSAPRLPAVKYSGLHPNLRIPWSTPVEVVDPFEGNFVAVFDRNDISSRDLGYSGPGKLVTLWRRESVRVLLITQQGGCSVAYSDSFLYRYGAFPYRHVYRLFPDEFYAPVCYGINTAQPIRKVLIKAGQSLVELEGTNNVFSINAQAAASLKNAPIQNADIRLVLAGGETVDSKIGKQTVAAWKTIY